VQVEKGEEIKMDGKEEGTQRATEGGTRRKELKRKAPERLNRSLKAINEKEREGREEIQVKLKLEGLRCKERKGMAWNKTPYTTKCHETT
jgi:hypothetical protein